MLRRLKGEPVEPTVEEEATRAALQAECDAIEAEHAGPEDLPDEVDARLGEIETALAALQNRPIAYDPADIAISGVFVSIDAKVGLRSSAASFGPKTRVLRRIRGNRTALSRQINIGHFRHRIRQRASMIREQKQCSFSPTWRASRQYKIYSDGVDDARAASGSMKGRAKMVVVRATV